MVGLFSICLASNVVLAKELGKFGPEYEIKEQPFLEMIADRLENVDIESANKELEKRARAEVKRPKPYKILSRATANREYHFDPTITLQQDIKTTDGKVIAKKGTTVNPLEKVTFDRQLYFIDSDDGAQMNWLTEQLDAQEQNNNFNKQKVILTKGSPQEASKSLKRRCYFDQGGVLVRKFRIKALPAKLEQSGKQLVINEYLIK